MSNINLLITYRTHKLRLFLKLEEISFQRISNKHMKSIGEFFMFTKYALNEKLFMIIFTNRARSYTHK